jgi:hypothetical protein
MAALALYGYSVVKDTRTPTRPLRDAKTARRAAHAPHPRRVQPARTKLIEVLTPRHECSGTAPALGNRALKVCDCLLRHRDRQSPHAVIVLHVRPRGRRSASTTTRSLRTGGGGPYAKNRLLRRTNTYDVRRSYRSGEHQISSVTDLLVVVCRANLPNYS